MELQLHMRINEGLFLRNPEGSELGKKIIKHCIQMIYKNGFEAFNFKKLAEDIGTTEASVYRYFENKHKLLIYLTSWYWGWVEFQISFHTNNIIDPILKLKKVIKLLATTVEDDTQTSHVNESLLHQIVIAEGSKAYLTKQVAEDNKQHFFKPYKDLFDVIGKLYWNVILNTNTQSHWLLPLSKWRIFKTFLCTTSPLLPTSKKLKRRLK